MTVDPVAAARNSLLGFGRVLLAVSLLLVGGAYLWRGIDFSLGVLLGTTVVGLNFFWTGRVVRGALLHDRPRAHLAVIYSLKFGLTAVILFVAILQFGIDPLGILVGVSALVLAVSVVAVMGKGR